jgi:septal ring factor EnvC (AmiA/AmiB activator)
MRRPRPLQRPDPLIIGAAALRCGVLSAALVLVCTLPAPARDAPDAKLKSVEQELQRTREQDKTLAEREAALQDELDALRGQLVEAAAAARAHEQSVGEHRHALVRIEAEEKVKVEALEGRRHQLSELLMALARHARQPPEALVALPASPEDTIRAALLLAAAVPEIEAEASTLKSDIDELETIRREAAATRQSLEKESRELARGRSRLETLIAQRANLQQQTQAERRKAQSDAERLAREAKDIKDLMERLEAERVTRAAEAAKLAVRTPRQKPPAPALPPPAAHRPGAAIAGLPRPIAPVTGRLLSSFGGRGEGGSINRGITVEVARGTAVLAPFAGRVVYAGPFRDYGQLLIIEHGEGYHLLLAGLGRIDSALGESVLAGEPIGTVGNTISTVAGGGSPSRLYLELRRNGRPIDPMPWLGTSTDKVSG